MNTSDHFPLPVPANDMPPIPLPFEKGPRVCATIQLYLAVLEDLPPEEAQRVLEHAQSCARCQPALRLMQQTTRLLTRLPASTPSAHVDQAVMRVISERAHRGATQVAEPAAIARPAPASGRRRRRRRGLLGAGTLALAAALLLALLATLHPGMGTATQAFALPAGLSWNGYVLFHSETAVDASGARYQVDTYHDLRTGRMHVETIMPGSIDVVAVGDDHDMLGLDMMHHVAAWGADAWSVDDTAFDLAVLRGDLKNGRAVYLDKDTFHGQPVYRIRYSNGLVLLLDMQYHPVNLLRGAHGPGTGEAMYSRLELMPASHVDSNMWDMSIPADFHMGNLPGRP
jgi:Putative zinc-finger